MSQKPIIVWFRQDLRIQDNPALAEAANKGTVLPIYILDDVNSGEWKMGGASRVWLHHALADLDKSLDGNLQIFSGDAEKIITKLISEKDVQAVYWNRCYEPWRISRDKEIKSALSDKDIDVESFNGSLLWEPWNVRKGDGTMYKVFTPYYKRGCLEKPDPREPLGKLKSISYADTVTDSEKINKLGLLPKTLDWHDSIEDFWTISEAGAHEKLDIFLENGLNDYKEGRNFPSQKNTSCLSPYLHFGQISPNQIWHKSRAYGLSEGMENDLATFCSELGWREFSYSLLYNFPEFPRKNWQAKFDNFPWETNPEGLKAWQKGRTGYPIVDAGMRELWHTGYMHNRVRMIVGSFLVKNLMLNWQLGEEWFWDCLVDADLASNSASWQWIGGCGADAAPYFRIFNPITQGQKFDKHGTYIKKWVPELKDMPDKYLSNPWEAPEDVLENANVKLGKDYPKPIVNLKASRERALAAFKTLKAPE